MESLSTSPLSYSLILSPSSLNRLEQEFLSGYCIITFLVSILSRAPISIAPYTQLQQNLPSLNFYQLFLLPFGVTKPPLFFIHLFSFQENLNPLMQASSMHIFLNEHLIPLNHEFSFFKNIFLIVIFVHVIDDNDCCYT